VKLVKKETFNRWYTLTPYYMALTVSRLPVQVLLNITFMAVTYWMSGLPQQFWRFCIFVAVGLMISLVAEGMGLAIGATFSITVSFLTASEVYFWAKTSHSHCRMAVWWVRC